MHLYCTNSYMNMSLNGTFKSFPIKLPFCSHSSLLDPNPVWIQFHHSLPSRCPLLSLSLISTFISFRFPRDQNKRCVRNHQMCMCVCFLLCWYVWEADHISSFVCFYAHWCRCYHNTRAVWNAAGVSEVLLCVCVLIFHYSSPVGFTIKMSWRGVF